VHYLLIDHEVVGIESRSNECFGSRAVTGAYIQELEFNYGPFKVGKNLISSSLSNLGKKQPSDHDILIC
jgi:hypothetical protein